MKAELRRGGWKSLVHCIRAGGLWKAGFNAKGRLWRQVLQVESP